MWLTKAHTSQEAPTFINGSSSQTPDKLFVEPIKEKVSLRSLQIPEGHEGSLNGMNV